MKPKLNRVGPALKHHPGFFEDDRVPGMLCMNFLGSDRSVVQRRCTVSPVLYRHLVLSGTQDMQTLADKNYQGFYHNCYLAVSIDYSPYSSVMLFTQVQNTISNKLGFIIFGGLVNFLCKYTWGRKLLLK